MFSSSMSVENLIGIQHKPYQHGISHLNHVFMYQGCFLEDMCCIILVRTSHH